jgi:hypothetical protein
MIAAQSVPQARVDPSAAGKHGGASSAAGASSESHVSTSHRLPIRFKSSTATPIKSTCLLTYSLVFLLFALPLTY